MANELRFSLAHLEKSDADIVRELRWQIDPVQNRRQLGLNFERHTPELVAFTSRAISVCDEARFLARRGQAKADSDATCIVSAISGPKGNRVARSFDSKTKDETKHAIEDLVFVADFRAPIYRVLTPLSRQKDR